MQSEMLLIVDDEEDLVSTLAERLELRGFQVETATSGIDALRHIGESEFSVLLLDVKMPGIGGVELLAEMRRKHLDLPVILFTGHGSVAEAKRGTQEGAFDYLMKPIDIEILVEKIRSAAGKAKGREP